MVSSTPRPHFTPGKDPVPIVQEAAWAPGPVWTGGKSHPHRDSIPDCSAHSQSLYRLSYRAHLVGVIVSRIYKGIGMWIAFLFILLFVACCDSVFKVIVPRLSRRQLFMNTIVDGGCGIQGCTPTYRTNSWLKL